MGSMKATAIAHPIQGLVKYHGLVDPVRRIPYHGSISLATTPTRTRTTVEALARPGQDSVTIDGENVTGRSLERVKTVLDAVREVAEEKVAFRMASESNFPKYVGLGSSASGFAALAVAACGALKLPLDLTEMSELARLGAGSATRAVTGGFSEWITRASKSYGRCLAEPGKMDWATVALVVNHPVPTEDAHRVIKTSPFFRSRLDYIEGTLKEAREAILRKDSLKLMAIAERDTLNLHAVTMTTESGLLAWKGITVEAMHRVRRMREEGVPAYFSIDTGATVYVNTLSKHRDAVRSALWEIAADKDLLDLDPAPAAHLVNDHLF